MKNPNEDFKRITVDQNLFDTIRRKNAFICDMDGVLYHGNRLIPGAKDFIEWLKREKKKFLFLTNSSERSPQELADKLQRLGIDVDKEHFYTSALATAEFLASQKPGGSAYIIGEAGLINALYNVGYTINDVNPDYVVVGEARTYNLEVLTHSVNLVRRGAAEPVWSAPIPILRDRSKRELCRRREHWSNRSSWPPEKNATLSANRIR